MKELMDIVVIWEIVLSTWSLILPFIALFVLYRRRLKNCEIPLRRGLTDRSLTYPRQYPCDWYRICHSDEISKRGAVKHAFALGGEMVIFRSDDEQQQPVYVFDAFCIHIGANLAVGGRVVPGANCLQCPFHLWKFSGQDGRCTKIPYIGGKLPKKEKMQTYLCVERHGMMMIWYHPLDEPQHYDAICIDELLDDRLDFRDVYRYPNTQSNRVSMGCSPSSVNRISSEYGLNSNEITYLTQSWNIIKTQDLQKFGLDILIRTSNQSPIMRDYWRSKIQVSGNNYDYSQHDSCLRTDSSWHVGLRDYSAQLIAIFDQLLSVIHTKNQFLMQIQSLSMLENIFLLDFQALSIMKKCMIEILHERFTAINGNSLEDYERVWGKFLTFIIDYMLKQKKITEKSSETIVSRMN